MLDWIGERAAALWVTVNRRFLWWIGAAWFILGTYDTIGAQLVPEWIATRLPRAYRVVEMTTGLLPWWAWGWIGTALLAAAAIEYLVRLKRLVDGVPAQRLKAFAVLKLQRDPWRTDMIKGSLNVKHVESHTDDSVTVEFTDPVPHRQLTARIAGTEDEIELLEVTPFRARFWLDPFKSVQIVFEAPY